MICGGIICQVVFYGLCEDKLVCEVIGECFVGLLLLFGVCKVGVGVLWVVIVGVCISYLQWLIDLLIQVSKLEFVEFYVCYVDLFLCDLCECLVLLVCGFDGIGGELFFQKYVVCLKIFGIVQFDLVFDFGYLLLLQICSVEVLVGVVQMGSIEFYIWNVSLVNLEWFDCFVFDFDLDLVLLWKCMFEVI